ncbi:hypothetical protein ACFL3S_07970 [Gemmatimonadota bacterium]
MGPECHRRVQRPASYRGAGLFFLLVIAVPLDGCANAGDRVPGRDEELAQSLGLPGGAVIHRVNLGGWGSEEHAVPSRVRAAPGDAVVFETVDHRVHTVSFFPDSLSPGGLAFLERTGGLSSPPLVTRGSTFVVVLDGAPPGRYSFLSEGHGGQAMGIIVVEEAAVDEPLEGRD